MLKRMAIGTAAVVLWLGVAVLVLGLAIAPMVICAAVDAPGWVSFLFTYPWWAVVVFALCFALTPSKRRLTIKEEQ